VFEDREFQRRSCCCVHCGSLLYVFGGGEEFRGLQNQSFTCFDLNSNCWLSTLPQGVGSMPKDEGSGYFKNASDASAIYIPGASYFYERLL